MVSASQPLVGRRSNQPKPYNNESAYTNQEKMLLYRRINREPYFMRALILALYFGFGLQAAGVAAQTLANKQFDIRYSSAGLTSLKHVQDVYDTDYVASGRALGDVLIRYRKSGETEWRLAQAAHDPQAEGQRVSFSI